MNPHSQAAFRALVFAGALMLSPWCQSAETGSADASAEALPSTRSLSARLTAILVASLPRYAPAHPTAEKMTARAPGTDDDSILHLPKYVVHSPRPPALREGDIHTEKAVTELAMRRYSSQLDQALNHYRIPLFSISPEARAQAAYAEDERLRKMDDLDRVARAIALVDWADAANIRRLADATFQR